MSVCDCVEGIDAKIKTAYFGRSGYYLAVGIGTPVPELREALLNHLD